MSVCPDRSVSFRLVDAPQRRWRGLADRGESGAENQERARRHPACGAPVAGVVDPLASKLSGDTRAAERVNDGIDRVQNFQGRRINHAGEYTAVLYFR